MPSAVGQHRPGIPSAEHVGCTSHEAWLDEGDGGGGGRGVPAAPLEPASDSSRLASSTQMECSARAASMIELSKGDVTEQFTSKESSSRLHVAGAAG